MSSISKIATSMGLATHGDEHSADLVRLVSNFEENCIPLVMLKAGVLPYEDFLKKRKKLMAQKMKKYFQSLGEIQMDSE